jgi:hypothetical protein
VTLFSCTIYARKKTLLNFKKLKIFIVSYKIGEFAGHWWLLPVILATCEAKIGKIVDQGWPGQIVCETLSHKLEVWLKW